MAEIAKIAAEPIAKPIVNYGDLFAVAMFSGIGLLLSLAVIILDKYTPGEWF